MGLLTLAIIATSLTNLEYPALQVPVLVAICARILTSLLRFGLVATMAAYFTGNELFQHALTLDFSTWYAGNSMIVLLLPVGLVIFAFWTSLAGRSVFADDL